MRYVRDFRMLFRIVGCQEQELLLLCRLYNRVVGSNEGEQYLHGGWIQQVKIITKQHQRSCLGDGSYQYSKQVVPLWLRYLGDALVENTPAVLLKAGCVAVGNSVGLGAIVCHD